jgi:hypothetical protein
LPEVQQVVTGVQPPQVLEALLTALGVDPHSGQIRETQMLPDPHVCPAERGKLFEGVPDVDVAVSEATRPEILIVAHQRWPIVRHDHTKPEAAHELGVREMLDHFTNGPLPGSLWRCHELGRHRVEESLNIGRGLAEDRDGIAVAEQVEKRGNVGRRVGRRGRSGIAEDAHGSNFRFRFRTPVWIARALVARASLHRVLH